MTTSTAQDFLFQRIKEILPQQVSMVDAVSDILHVSSDSAYRRIRGETPLVLEEAKQLCDHFHLSLDQLLSVKTGFTLFQTERIHYKNHTFEKYLGGMLEQLQQVSGFFSKEIIYLSKDIPMFHNFSTELLFAFRYFFWMKSILRHPDYENRRFTMDCLTPEIKKLGVDIVQAYNNIPSIEIWNTECVNSIIFQVEYYRDAGFFSSTADVKAVYDAVEEAIYHLKDQAEYGCKFLPGENPQVKKNNFKFFYNRVTLGDNTIMAIADNLKTVFLNYDVMNYMVTRDEKFCNDTYEDLQALIRRSSLISITSEKQRNIFFNMLAGKIQDRKRYL
jgi:BetR domain